MYLRLYLVHKKYYILSIIFTIFSNIIFEPNLTQRKQKAKAIREMMSKPLSNTKKAKGKSKKENDEHLTRMRTPSFIFCSISKRIRLCLQKLLRGDSELFFCS